MHCRTSLTRTVSGALLFGFVAIAAPGANAKITAEAAVGFAQSFAAEVAEAVNADGDTGQLASLQALVRARFDIRTISRFVLGSNWESATAVERSDFQSLFADYMTLTHAGVIARFATGQVDILETRGIGRRDMLVTTRVSAPPDEPVSIAWRVRAYDDAYRFVDVIVGGVSLVRTKREEIGAVTTTSGISGLLALLRDKVNSATPN